MIKNGDKLYIVTRRDIPAGYQAVQSIHAAQEFAVKFPTINKEWQQNSNYLGLLSVRNEVELKRLASKAVKKGLAVSLFCEPDVNWRVTAIAIAPSKKARTLCKGLPLGLREFKRK